MAGTIITTTIAIASRNIGRTVLTFIYTLLL
jgi:hypothetical protein